MSGDGNEDLPETGSVGGDGIPYTGDVDGGDIPYKGDVDGGHIPHTGSVDGDPAQTVAKALLCFNDKFVSDFMEVPNIQFQLSFIEFLWRVMLCTEKTSHQLVWCVNLLPVWIKTPDLQQL